MFPGLNTFGCLILQCLNYILCLCYIELDPCTGDVIAYYKFDRSFRDVCFGYNGQNRSRWSYPQLKPSSGILNGAAYFNYNELPVPSLNGYEWSSNFSVSLWFKRDDKPLIYPYETIIEGLINNYGTSDKAIGSWEIHIASPIADADYISATVVTSESSKTWANITAAVAFNWHHLVMTYDGKTINFYLNNHLKLTDSKCCHGNIVSSNNDVVIGKREIDDGNDVNLGYFHGYMDEVMLFRKTLTAEEVTRLYQLKIV